MMVVDELTVNNQTKFGIYNLVSNGYVSWFGFAKEILNIAKRKNLKLKIIKINPILSKDYKTPAVRPLNSRLSIKKFEDEFGISIISWNQSLKNNFPF